jgi:hypothetical protein
LHIQLLEHASQCNSGACTSTNCQKMKGFLSHERQCQVSISLSASILLKAVYCQILLTFSY